MAVKLTDTSAIVTAGRGRNQIVRLEVSLVDLEKWAKKAGVDTKAAFRVSYGRAVKGLRNKFQKVVSRAGGVEGVPKFRDFEEFTKELRAAENRSSRPMGGVLAEPHVIVAYRENGWQVIGWPDRLAKWAVNFQDGIGDEKQFTDPYYRHKWHRKGIKDVPRNYVHNPRRVVPEPFGTYVDKHLESWAQDALHKELARAMVKAKGL